ncbi:MAG: hypothetical protein GXY87_05950 [Tissierellia bacterium]|nr:hypothetical protein [Tissierellia bacterium]
MIYIKVNKIEYTHKEIPNEFNNYKILQISDIYLKADDKLDDFTEIITKSKPNIIVFTGNTFVEEDEKYYENLINLKDQIDSSILIYVSLGQTELNLSETYRKELISKLSNNGIYTLDDRRISLVHGGKVINLIGVTPNIDDYGMDGNNLKLKKRLNLVEDNFTIALSNNPGYFPELSILDVDLVLSGARSGGWIRLPFVGGINYDVDSLYKEGQYEAIDSRMIISNGSGTRKGNVRILNPRMVNEIILKR